MAFPSRSTFVNEDARNVFSMYLIVVLEKTKAAYNLERPDSFSARMPSDGRTETFSPATPAMLTYFCATQSGRIDLSNQNRLLPEAKKRTARPKAFRLPSDGLDGRLEQGVAPIQTLAIDLAARKAGVREQQRTE
jgi:hypothetical protein